MFYPFLFSLITVHDVPFFQTLAIPFLEGFEGGAEVKMKHL